MSSTVTELLRDTASPTLGFEFFPPRTPEEQLRFEATVAELDRFHPAFLSVTYGASGSTRDRTVATVAALGSVQHTTVADHLTYVLRSTDDLLRIPDAFADAGVSDILAIREDMPDGPQQPWERYPDGLGNTMGLARLIKTHSDFCVGVAAFLNVHQPNNDPELDVRIVVEKAATGADYAITRLFFESHRYVELMNRVRGRGSQIPIIPGIALLMVITQIGRFASLADYPLPKDFVAVLRAARNPADVHDTGLPRATNLYREPLTTGAPGLQFFTQGH